MAAREVVVLAVALFAGLIVLAPWILQRRAQARRSLCEFRQIQTAEAIIRWENRVGRFPGTREVLPTTDRSIGWTTAILDDLDRSPRGESPWAAAAELVMSDVESNPTTLIITLLCPAAEPPEEGWGPRSHWVINSGMPDALQPATDAPVDWRENGIAHDQSAAHPQSVSLDYLIKHDGSNATLLITENMGAGNWYDHGELLTGFVWRADVKGVDAVRDPLQLLGINEEVGRSDQTSRFMRPASFHLGGVNAVYASGRTQFLHQSIDYVVYTQLMSTHGAEVKQPGGDELIPPPYRH